MFEKLQLEYHKQFLLCKLLISILIFRDCCSILEVFVAILLDWGEKGEKSGSNHIVGRHDTQHNDIHHCDIQHNIKIVNLKFNMYFCYAELRLCSVFYAECLFLSDHIVGRHDTQQNDIHHCDIQHNIKNTRHYNICC